MKKIITLVALTLMLTFIFSLVSAPKVNAQPTESGKITVSGCGEVTLVPDTAMIFVGVKTTAETLEQANNENKEKINKLYETLKENNIVDNNIQTKNFYAHEEYSYNETEPKLTGYTVSNQVFIKTTDLENLTSLVSSLMSDGANNFNGINFSSSKESESYKTALSNALSDAKEKAKILTNANTVNIVEIIEESVSSFRNFVNYSKAEMMSDNSFFGGELLVKARVTVVFMTQINETTVNKETITTKEKQQENTTSEENTTGEDKISENISENKISEDISENKISEDNKINEEKIDVSEPTNLANEIANKNTTSPTQEKPITLPKRLRPTKTPTSPQII